MVERSYPDISGPRQDAAALDKDALEAAIKAYWGDPGYTTTGIVAAIQAYISFGAPAQPPTKPWVCCNCDADLSCGACGVEQPNDSAYYEGIVKENERLKDRLADAQRIIAEYKAITTAAAKADVAAHGLPGARGQVVPEPDIEELADAAESVLLPEITKLRDVLVHLNLAVDDYWNYGRTDGCVKNICYWQFKAKEAMAVTSTHQSAPPFTASQNIAEREPSSDAALGGADTVNFNGRIVTWTEVEAAVRARNTAISSTDGASR